MANLWKCPRCDFSAQTANEMEGHIRNIHGWRTPASVHTLAPKRCDLSLPGLGRCRDTSGIEHGHWFKPGQFDAGLMLSEDEARELVDYMADQYLNRNTWPMLSAMLNRIEAHLKVTV